MAVPAPGERKWIYVVEMNPQEPSLLPPNSRDGCELGSSPNLSIAFVDQPGQGVLTISLNDTVLNSSSFWVAGYYLLNYLC